MVLLFSPTVALAQLSYPSQWWSPEALAQWVFPGMSPDWLRVPNVIWYVLVPFFTAVVIIYAILEELRIFRHQPKKLTGVIALCFAFLLLPSGILTYIVNVFYAAGAFIGMIAFGALFMVGVILWAWGRGREFYYTTGVEGEMQRDSRDQLRHIRDKMADLRVKRDKASNEKEKDKIDKQIDNLMKERKALVDKLRSLEEHV
jgi:hypothetical protein